METQDFLSTFKRGVGRPIVVGATQALVVGISPEQKAQAVALAKQRGCSTSELVRRLIEREVEEG